MEALLQRAALLAVVCGLLLWGTLIVIALYEWQVLVAVALIALALFIWPPRRRAR